MSCGKTKQIAEQLCQNTTIRPLGRSPSDFAT